MPADKRRYIQRIRGRHHVVDARVTKDVLELQTAKEARQRHDRLARHPSGKLRDRPVIPLAPSRPMTEEAHAVRRPRPRHGGELSSRIGRLVRHRRVASPRSAAVTQNSRSSPSTKALAVLSSKGGIFAVNGAHARRELVVGPPGVGIGNARASATASGISGRPMRSSSALRGGVAVKNAHSKPAASPQAMICGETIQQYAASGWPAR